MEIEKHNDKYLIAGGLAIGAVGGLILGSYLWGTKGSDKTLSKHLATLSQVLEEIEGINTEEAENLKERIQNVLQAIETYYGNNKE